jgi:hypothetical protein
MFNVENGWCQLQDNHKLSCCRVITRPAAARCSRLSHASLAQAIEESYGKNAGIDAGSCSHLDDVGVVDRRQQPPLVEHVLHLLQPQQLLLAQHLQRDEAVVRPPPRQLDAPKGAGACEMKAEQWQPCNSPYLLPTVRVQECQCVADPAVVKMECNAAIRAVGGDSPIVARMSRSASEVHAQVSGGCTVRRLTGAEALRVVAKGSLSGGSRMADVAAARASPRQDVSSSPSEDARLVLEAAGGSGLRPPPLLVRKSLSLPKRSLPLLLARCSSCALTDDSLLLDTDILSSADRRNSCTDHATE